MATNTQIQKFVVKKLKLGAPKDSEHGPQPEKFWSEVGRLVLRTTAKGTTGSLYLHILDGELAVFPVKAKQDQEPAQDEGDFPPA